MIPYAIMGLELGFKNGEKLAVRVLDLSEEYLTFRLSKRYPAERVLTAGPINAVFYEADSAAYRTISLQDFEISLFMEEEYWTEYQLTCRDRTFRQAARKLSGEYLNYISLKIEASDGELSQVLCGYPAKKDAIFAKEFTEQRRLWLSETAKSCDWPSSIRKMPLAIRLSEPTHYEAYLEQPFHEFLQKRYDETGLTGHPITAFSVKYLYIGNLSSVYQLPDVKCLDRLLEKAADEDLIPVLCLPPLEEGDFQAVRELLAGKSGIELVLSDWGILEELSRDPAGRFLLNFGPLLHKQRKDPRISYKKGLEPALLGDNAVSCQAFRDFLQSRFGVTRYGFSCSGYDYELPRVSGDLWLPFYMMNRGRPEYIRTEGRRYPEHLHMVGRDSSLYGFDDQILTSQELFETMTQTGIDRIVLEVL